MSTDRAFSLRRTLPLALFAALLTAVLVALWHQTSEHHAATMELAERDLLTAADQLARRAEASLIREPHMVASELSLLATDRRSLTLAVIDPGGRIVIGDRLVMGGKPAAATLPDFTAERFAQAQASSQPLVWRGSGDRMGVALGYDLPLEGKKGSVRNLEHGVVWIEFDLAHELALGRHQTLAELLPVLVCAVLVTMGLAWVLRTQVTRPLAALGRASEELAQTGRLAQPLLPEGAREIRALGRRFNQMAREVAAARQDAETARARTVSLVESAMDAILTIDGAQRVVMANPAALQLFGVEESTLLGQPIDVLLPERFREQHREHVRRFGEEQITQRHAASVSVVFGRRWNGEEFPAEASISHAKVQGADFYTVILRDVTERRRAEDEIHALNTHLEATVQERTASLQSTADALARERDRLKQLTQEVTLIVESATVGILLIKDRKVLRCNTKAEELFGYAPGAGVGQPTRDWYLSQADYDTVGAELNADLDAGRTHLREHLMRRSDGRLFWARISARRLDRDDGQVTLAVVEDLTPEHDAAEALAAAKVQAETASVAKSRFLANMSHEIRTPMNAIIGMAHLALRTPLDAQQRDYLHKIQMSSQHLLGVINEILDFSKIEADKLVLERIDFQLLPVLDNVFTLIGNKAADKGLELVLDLEPEVPNCLLGDPLRLGQVLINLGSNAVKFTEQGDVVVRVKLLGQDEGVAQLRFEVSDTGVGLRRDQIEQLFQSFHQADASTSRQHGGTGLGLAISQRLVQLMGGEIGVDSEPGRGSTFWFTARFGFGAQSELVLDPSQLQGRRVLAVDDNEAARDVIARLLDSLGLQADTASDGLQAVAAVQAAQAEGRPYDVVLLDWSMPQMTGIETGQHIRALPLPQQPRLMLVTGRGRDEVLREALENGFSTVMVKPVNASVLFDNLLLSLAPQAARTHAPATAPTAPGAQVQGRVLVVEDNAINQQIAREMLQDLGLTVELAHHGQEALHRLDTEPPFDLVFMDMHMPVMDGLAATRALRADPRWTTLPVIAMTANVMTEDRDRCTAAGMNDFVAKPVDVDALVATVRRWLPALSPAMAPPSGPVPVANDPRLAPLQLIHGLDLRAGLRRCGHKADLYLELLQRFVDSQSSTVMDLQQLGGSLRRGDGLAPDIEPLRLRVHSLKGVAGNLGATLLHSRCEAAERRLHEDPLAAGEAIGAIESTTRTLSEALRTALAQAVGGALQPPQGAASAQHAAEAHLPALAKLLRDGDPDALGWLQRHLPALQHLLGHEAEVLFAKVQQFEFDNALALLTPHLPTTP